MRVIKGMGAGRTAAVAALAAFALLAMAAGAQAKTRKSVHGTVVHRNAKAGTFTVATGKGRLFAIHSDSSPGVGTKVKVGVRKLANRTYGATTLVAGKHRSKARLHGRVSHVSADGTSYTVSSRGVSMLVHTRPGGAAPAVGTIVTVSGTLEEEDQNEEATAEDQDQNEGNLEEEDLQEEGEDTDGFVVEGTILEINTLERTLTISSDDDQESGETDVVKVPPSFDMSLFSVGQEVELNVLPLGGGQFELLGSADDEGEQGADEDEDDQGELGGDEDEQGENEQ